MFYTPPMKEPVKLLLYRVTFKFKSWSYTRTIYATDKADCIKRANLLKRDSYRIGDIIQVD